MQFTDGVYQGKFIKGELCQTQNNKPQVACDFEVTMVAGRDTEDNPAWQPLAGGATKRTIYLSLVEKAKPYTAKKLTALGFDGNFSLSSLAFSKIGESIRLTCNMEEYDGKTREKWELLDWGGTIERTSVESAEAIVLNAWWKATTAPAPEAPAAKGDVPPSGDDIPF